MTRELTWGDILRPKHRKPDSPKVQIGEDLYLIDDRTLSLTPSGHTSDLFPEQGSGESQNSENG